MTSAKFETVVEYLANEGISDREDLQAYESPQNRAAWWIAEEDLASLTVPTSGSTDDTYRYVARYVMAVNYYAMGGEGWHSQLNFLSEDDICQWQDADLGVRCSTERPDIPVTLYLGEFVPSFVRS